MVELLQAIDDFLYVPVLVLILICGGLYFTFRTGFVQIRLLKESIKLIMEPPATEGENHVSSFQALMVSTASRVARVILSVCLQQFVSEDRVLYSGCGSLRSLGLPVLSWKVLWHRSIKALISVLQKTAKRR